MRADELSGAAAPSPPPGLVTIGRFDQRPGYRVNRPRGSDSWLFTWTTGGHGLLEQGAARTVTRAGDLVVLGPGTAHRYSVEPGAGHWAFWWAHCQARPAWVARLRPYALTDGLYAVRPETDAAESGGPVGGGAGSGGPVAGGTDPCRPDTGGPVAGGADPCRPDTGGAESGGAESGGPVGGGAEFGGLVGGGTASGGPVGRDTQAGGLVTVDAGPGGPDATGAGPLRSRIETAFRRMYSDARWTGAGPPPGPVRPAPGGVAVAHGTAARELTLCSLEEIVLLATARAEHRGPGVDARIRHAESLIAADPSVPHSVRSLAAAVSLSPSRFAHLFTEQLGRSPMRALRDARLLHAARLLEATELPVGRVAAASGFTSAFHFNRVFRQRYGMPPGAYRNAAITGAGEAAAT
ncbi:AraC family transcriptional regulator [Streptomyces siamensis]|uniref:HTH araC/xylS-type domain-containing protein n=1 Tax=Streptomyces siamensis TaxID=1274986 RepID=A0ABP9J4F5_9ACTN